MNHGYNEIMNAMELSVEKAIESNLDKCSEIFYISQYGFDHNYVQYLIQDVADDYVDAGYDIQIYHIESENSGLNTITIYLSWNETRMTKRASSMKNKLLKYANSKEYTYFMKKPSIYTWFVESVIGFVNQCVSLVF